MVDSFHVPESSATAVGPADVNSRSAIISAIVLGTIGVLSFIIQPGVVAGFVGELGYDEAQSVNLAGIEMLGVATSAILLAFFGNRLNWRLVVLLGLALAICGNLLSAAMLQLPAFWAARLVAGLGHGMIISISFTFIGITRHSERNLALYLVLLLTYGAFGLWYLPNYLAAFGFASLFSGFAVLCLIAMLTVRYVPRTYVAEAVDAPEARQLARPLILLALAGVLAYNLAQGIAWGVLALIGFAAGHGEQPVADALFLSQILAIAGALVAVFLAERITSQLAIAIGILGGGGSIALLLGRPDYTTFLIAVCGFNVLWNFVLPFILAKVCDFEISGRMISYAIALQMIGLGAGPLLAAPLIVNGSFLRVELVCIGFFLLSYLLLLVPMNAHKRLLKSETTV